MLGKLRSTVLTAVLALCFAPAASAATFEPAPDSPYATTDPAFVTSPGGFLGGAATADFNNDGIDDVAVVDETGVPVFSSGESVSLLLGTRGGGLALAPGPPISIYSGGNVSEPAPIATGDFNADGNADLVVVNAIQNTVEILLGNGHGEFHLGGTPVPLSGWGSAASIAVGDFNGDGNEDVAIADESLSVFLGNGSGGLTPAPGSPVTLPAYGSSVVAGHFYGSRFDDLAVAGISGEVSVYLGSVSGELHATGESPIAVGGESNRLAVGDFNDDGNADLAVLSSSSEDVAELLGNGAGGFATAIGSPYPVPGAASSSEPGLPESIGVGDFTCDGLPSLAIANYNGSSDSVALLEGDGSGGFTSPSGSLYPVNGNPRSLLVGDFNGDGKPDVAVVNPFQGTVTELVNATGSGSCPSLRTPTASGLSPYENEEAEPSKTQLQSDLPTDGDSSSPSESSANTKPQPQPSIGLDALAPTIKALTLRRRVIRAGRGFTLNVTLSHSATIVVEFDNAVVRHGRAASHAPVRLLGSITLDGRPGVNRFTIKRVGGRPLSVGTYTVVAFARTAAGTSARKTIALTVTR
jgi:hypothetical protein